MRIFLLFIGLLITCVIPLHSSANSTAHEAYFNEYLPIVGLKLKYGDFPGPISPILGKWALARQVLEDGINRRFGESCAGISRGGFNEIALRKAIGKDNISIGSASDGEGTFYYIKGPYANVTSATAIAYLFDNYVGRFLNKDKRQWYHAKEVSKAIQLDPDSFELNHKFHCILKPDSIIKRCNQLYGPQSGAVEDIVNRSVR